ncbi:MAG: type I restriction-modification system subunit M [Fastidiosipilaceae bacterium]|jgi:type I restriction enzyme M protein|nr:type I restriction-modification system subunit M [Clostridiaceae bacterium]
MITSDEIRRRLWNGANELRGSMDASRYKDYMLGLMFYKFLSDKTLEQFRIASNMDVSLDEEKLLDAYFEAAEQFGDQLSLMINSILGYSVRPEYLYQTWLRDISNGDFELQQVTDSLGHFERTMGIKEQGGDFEGLFATTSIDFNDTALGSNLNERSRNIKSLILLFADLNMVQLQKGDVLGDAYEYLIGMFAMESGKKAGEFYTPHQVSEVMAQIVAQSKDIDSIYDPTVGSGSLLLTVGRHLDIDKQKTLHYYGQEKNTATYNLCRMNLLLHGVRPELMTIRNADTLAEDWPEDPEHPNEGMQFDAVVMNPPYSLKNWNRSDIKVSDPRFEIAGVLPPNSKGDFAFLLHGLYHLNPQGTMAIVLPHGVLFRGATEGEIRKRLIDKNYIDTIIGMPANLFTNTGIPVVVIILKKNRDLDEPILFINAAEHFIKVGRQNALREKDIARIVDTYINRSEREGYSHLADIAEIVDNDYNLNIPRYISSIDQDIPQDVDAHLLGGLPQENIDQLYVLNKVVPDILKEAFKSIRPGYLELTMSIETLTEKILSHDRVMQVAKELANETQGYIDRYWDRLRTIDFDTDLNELMKTMLEDMKDILQSYDYIDVYEGYQVIAEIWNDNLASDLELLKVTKDKDFYDLGRSREPHMVTKGSGSKRRQEQDGWDGSLVTTELIEKYLYQSDVQNIEDKRLQIDGIESALSELVEAAKVEDSDENAALYDALRKNADDEPGDSFDNRSVKEELKVAEKGTEEYKWLKQVERLMADRTRVNREIKEAEKALKETVQERIVHLTNEEIDTLVYDKWFGNCIDEISDLIHAPLKKELDTLAMFQERYADTLADIDDEIRAMEDVLAELSRELVVVS